MLETSINYSHDVSTAKVVTRSTILILSGILIGIGGNVWFPPQMHTFLLFAGLTGLVSWIGFEMMTKKRHQRQVEHQVEEKTAQVEQRLERHVPACHITQSRPMIKRY